MFKLIIIEHIISSAKITVFNYVNYKPFANIGWVKHTNLRVTDGLGAPKS